MDKKDKYSLILKTRKIQIPSDFPTLNDINPYIYKTLIKTHVYEVRSNISDKTFHEFIEHWINYETPHLSQDNIQEFELLSQEFDRMSDVIQLYKKTVSNNSFLIHKQQFLKDKFIKKTTKEDIETKNYSHLIHNFFNMNLSEFKYIYLRSKGEILESLEDGDYNYFDLLQKRKTILNGIEYTINEEDKTAGVLRNSTSNSNIFIPKSINYLLNDYIVTIIHSYAFRNSNYIESIQFADDSELSIIDKEAFYDTSITNVKIPSSVTQICERAFSDCSKLQSIEFSYDSQLKKIGKEAISYSRMNKLMIPSNVIELETGWCRGMNTIKNIVIMPNNKQFSCFGEELIIGKSDINNDIYDTLYFASRGIKEASIPTFIKYISPYAFDECKTLKSIEFSEDSELFAIKNFAFSYSSISRIVIPKYVTKIGKYAFFSCSNLKDIEFHENCELISIGRNAFHYSGIISILIPYHLKEIHAYAFSNCLNLKNIDLDENSELVSIEEFAFLNTIICGIFIPPHVKYIGDGAFYGIEIVEISENSELEVINADDFDVSIIMIPSHLSNLLVNI